MLLTPHTAVGIVVAAAVREPLLAVPLSFLLHFVGDLVPHWDFFSETKSSEERKEGWQIAGIIFDVALGVGIGLSATLYALWILWDARLAITIFLSGIASILPDAISGTELYFNKSNAFVKWIGKIQEKNQWQAPLPWGIITQVIVLFVCALLSLSLLK